VDAYATAVHLQPDFAEAFYGAGTALLRLGDDGVAVRMFDEAVRIRPAFAEAFYNRAVALAALGRAEEAIVSCRQALRAAPRLRQALALLDALVRAHGSSARTDTGHR
jgi:tetratricopeptide (TPR) repeat protein